MELRVAIRETKGKGKGVYAIHNISAGQTILTNDVRKLKKYSLKEVAQNPKLAKISDHCDYVGRGKYVFDFSPESFVNHCCEPNAYIEFSTIGRTKLIATRDIKRGEEITKDYALSAIDQIRGAYQNMHYWKMQCRCMSKKCRKTIHGDFFRMPLHFQKMNYRFLPTWTKRKYAERINKLAKKI
ncbi:hypothetical protein CMO91_00830 [Candidatus Woesearchaeota archaeon]|nr:hypothetical protein [Candidatus Woesearchaeota archaeon]|tara:strand:- start:15 stop:566 length:552 start_codon:yes stop_codon:yes gene_type:complete